MDLFSTSIPNSVVVNGHFCPLTLSIYETDGFPQGALDFRDAEFNSFDGLREIVRERSEQMPDDQLLATLVSIHEHDHFLRFVSTELGLLIHSAMLINYFATCSLLHAMSSVGRRMPLNEVCAKFPPMITAVNDYIRTSRIYRVLWLGDTEISQQEACADINWLIETLGGTADTVKPDDPSAPAGFGWGMLHMLEASAVMAEEIILDKLQLPPDRKEQLLCRSERDHSLYFDMRNWLTEPLGSPILGLIALRMAFDGCVTGLIYEPLTKPVPYHNFHPCYLVNGLREALTQLFDGTKPDATPEIQSLYFSKHEVFDRLYGDLSEIAVKLGQCAMFKFERSKATIHSYEGLMARLPPDDNSAMAILLRRSAMPSVSYWLDSHERLRQKRLDHPELFILPDAWGGPVQIDNKYFQDPCATFTMLEGRGITSHSLMQIIHIEPAKQYSRLESVFNAIGLRFRLEVVSQVIGGTKFPQAVANVANRFRWAVPGGVGREHFDEALAYSLQHMDQILGGLD